MKKLPLLSLLVVLSLLAVNVPLMAQEYDDIYYNPDEDVPVAVIDRSSRSESGSEYTSEDDYYVDNDYNYASRIRRFRRPASGIGYYSDFYVNTYYYNPYAPVTTIYTVPAWSFNSWNNGRRWNRWANPYYDPFSPWNTWNSPWNAPYTNSWGYNSWNSPSFGFSNFGGAGNFYCPPVGTYFNNSNPVLNNYYNGSNSGGSPFVNVPRRGTNSTNGSNVNGNNNRPSRTLYRTGNGNTTTGNTDAGKVETPTRTRRSTPSTTRDTRRSTPSTTPRSNSRRSTPSTTPRSNSRSSGGDYNRGSSSPSRSTTPRSSGGSKSSGGSSSRRGRGGN